MLIYNPNLDILARNFSYTLTVHTFTLAKGIINYPVMLRKDQSREVTIPITLKPTRACKC